MSLWKILGHLIVATSLVLGIIIGQRIFFSGRTTCSSFKRASQPASRREPAAEDVITVAPQWHDTDHEKAVRWLKGHP